MIIISNKQIIVFSTQCNPDLINMWHSPNVTLAFPAYHDHSSYQRMVIGNKIGQTTIFVNVWSQIKQMRVIFSHLWVVVARHNF